MDIGIIVQARMGSTRLSGKVLRKFYKEQTLLEVLLNTLHKIKNLKVVVAIPENPDNDGLAEFLERKGEIVSRGSENDVLGRFIKAAEENGLEGVVRICSDNPFIDYNGLCLLIEKAKESCVDYIGYRINNKPSIKTHFGFWGEFVALGALKKVAAITNEVQAHEHVTIYIYTHPQDYKCEWIDSPDYCQGRDDIRLTVDTEMDFLNAQKIYSILKETNEDFGLKDVVDYLDGHSELKEVMKSMINQNIK